MAENTVGEIVERAERALQQRLSVELVEQAAEGADRWPDAQTVVFDHEAEEMTFLGEDDVVYGRLDYNE